MEKLVSVAEMQAIEREADAKGLSYAQMMENAGSGLARLIDIAHSHIGSKKIFALVGSGNNGGDALVALSILAERGWEISAYLVRPRQPDDPLVERARQRGGKIFASSTDENHRTLRNLLETNDVLVDGVLGTGIRLPLQGEVAACLLDARVYVQGHSRSLHVVAVDCPSGVNCDTGEVAPEAIPAEITVTMAAVKEGLLNFPAADMTGSLHVVSIGDLSNLDAWKNIDRWVCDQDYIRESIPPRPRNAHKGTFGSALIAAGCLYYTGAALLAGQAAYRAGAGLVQMAIPSRLHSILAGQLPEAVWLPLPDEDGFIAAEAADLIFDNLNKATAFLVGPGFGLRETTKEFIRKIITQDGETASIPPLVVDADGLKLLATIPDWFHKLPALSILTPHPGEMSILSGESVGLIQADRIRVAERYAAMWGHIVVLKGAFTVIASPEGKTVIVPVATPALARAGTGDVLAGLIAGLLAQGVHPYKAAVNGVWIHAMAGLKAESELGAASVLAGDLLSAIPNIFTEIKQ